MSEPINKSSSKGEKQLSQCPALLRDSGYWATLGKPPTTQRRELWKNIADQLYRLSEHIFTVTQRAVRVRFKLLSERFKKKMAAEEGASGINPEGSELDVLVEEILGKQVAYNEANISDLVSKKRK